MRIGARPRSLRIGPHEVRISRTTGGVVRLSGRDDADLAAGLGFAHAEDRLVQMVLVRAVAQGRLAECFKNDDGTVAIDVFMRTMGFAADAEGEVGRLSAAARALAEAYAAGVNARLERHRPPFELWLVGHRGEPWRVADTLATIKVMSFVGLAQMQLDLEMLIVQALHAGADAAKLKALFRPHLDAVDDDLVRLLRSVRLGERLVPEGLAFLSALPRLVASNNVVVAPARSATGAALAANDPHLEVNRLPPIWYEMVGETADDYRLGITMPGIPGLVMGRSRRVSFGFTYGFMDTMDLFVEEVRGGRYRRGEEWRDFQVRHETVRRKGAAPLELAILENDLGVLDADPRAARLEDGHYLTRAWTGYRGGAARSLNGIAAMLAAGGVGEAMAAAREATIPCNWLLADREGHIAYQQSGLLPVRSHSGLHPLPAWVEENRWRGLVPAEKLKAVIDPPEGVLATANDDHNPEGGPLAVNASMGPDRIERIRERLASRERLDLPDLEGIQLDVHSKQAERLMALLRPLLPDTAAGRLLRDWDLRYDADSRGATLFETVYAALLREVFGRGLLGVEVWDHLASETLLLAAYFHLFDRVLLEGDPLWFGSEGRGREGRDALFRRVIAEALGPADPARTPPWGSERAVMMRNVFFEGRLPRWLGFDHGPIPLVGSRATPRQGSVVRAHGRATTFAPSWRYLTDLGRDAARTALPGGPSGRRFSKHYKGDVELWLSGRYKDLRP